MTFHDDPAAYMRDWRKRKAAGLTGTVQKKIAIGRTGRPPKSAKPIAPRVDATLDRDAIMKASENELARVRSDIAAIQREGGAPVIVAANGRLRAVNNGGSRSTPALAPARAPRPSMIAIGGTPGRGLIPMGRGYPAPPDFAVRQFDRYEQMLAALANRSDELARELEAQARDHRALAARVAEIERRDNDARRGLKGLFSTIASALADKD